MGVHEQEWEARKLALTVARDLAVAQTAAGDSDWQASDLASSAERVLGFLLPTATTAEGGSDA